MSRVDCGDCPNVTSGCAAGHCLKADQADRETALQRLQALEDGTDVLISGKELDERLRAWSTAGEPMIDQSMQQLARGLGQQTDAALDAALCAHLGVERIDRQALTGRLTLTHLPDNHDEYAVDGVSVLRLGPVKVTQGKRHRANVWTATRTMERMP